MKEVRLSHWSPKGALCKKGMFHVFHRHGFHGGPYPTGMQDAGRGHSPLTIAMVAITSMS